MIPPHSGSGRRRSSPPPPARQPRGPCAIPGESAQARPGAGRSRGRGCRADLAAAPETPQLKRIWRGGRARERARSAGRSAGQTDRRTDAPAHADAQSSARFPSHTHTHTHTHADTHRDTHTRALTSSRQPARQLAGARSPLWPVSAAPPSAPLCGKPEAEGAGSLSGRPATETSSRPPGGEADARPRHAPMGLPAPPDWGRGPPRLWGAGSEQQPLPTKLVRGSREGGERAGWRSRVRASAAVAGARLLAASPLRGLKLRG